jgi:predicted MFS family arabinose efflux permease
VNDAGAPIHPLLSRGYKTWLVAVLLAANLFNFADRAILAVLAQPIKEDLALTDTDLGMLSGLGFALLYSILGVPLGWLAERVSRKGIIAVCVAVWSFMTAACGLATGFTTLLLGRVGVGIGEAGLQPPTYSLFADHFAANRRASIIAIFGLGSPLGFLFGQSLGGWVATQWSWRVAFFALGFPGLLSALLVWFTLREPPRGLVEGQVSTASPPSTKSVIAHLWAMPTFRHLLAGAVVSAFAFNAVAQFGLTFYLRSFHLPLAVAGAAFGVVALTSNGLGMLLGGFGFDWLARRDSRWLQWGPAAAVALAAPIYVGAFICERVWISMGLIWLANLVLITFYAPSIATVQNLVGPRMRAMTGAIFIAAFGLIGTGLGPTVLGMASDLFASRAFTAGGFIASCPGGHAAAGAPAALDAMCREASAQGLRHALISVQVVFFWAAIHYFLAARTSREDLYRPGVEA